MNRVPCIICHRPDREAIDHAIAQGASLREVGRAYNVQHTAVFRHKRDHTAHEIATLNGAHKVQDRGTALARLEALYTTAEKLLKKALKDSTSVNGQVQVVKEVRACLELIAKMTGELNERPQTVNLMMAPQWLQVRAALFQALEDHPQALEAVAGRLVALENNSRELVRG
ncbi:MAG: hypothetical protein M3456_07665 [Actinomycetota bacterium]|nr:hypothetical protein [Actinomycetota bacterium]